MEEGAAWMMGWEGSGQQILGLQGWDVGQVRVVAGRLGHDGQDWEAGSAPADPEGLAVVPRCYCWGYSVGVEWMALGK